MIGLLEKVIENWLDKAGEKTFQEAFCAMLAAEGHIIIHLTRHCAMELGKDIITIGPDGIPCAYQLKGNPGGKLSLSQWRGEINKQVIDLVSGKITHPSLDPSLPHHKAFLVTNGEIEEEVSRAIDDMNRGWANQGLSQRLEVIVRGQLLEKAKGLGLNLWPSELLDTKTLLELLLACGKSPLLKEKLIHLFEGIFLFHNEEASNKIKKDGLRRIASSAALLCAVATSSYKTQTNHLAEIEAWTIYLGYLFGAVERWNFEPQLVETEIQLAIDAIYNSLHRLYEELTMRSDYTEGDPLIDKIYIPYKIRMTWLIGLMSIFYLLRRETKEPENEIEKFILRFCSTHQSEMILAGESLIPLYLALYWKLRLSNQGKPEKVLCKLLVFLSERNQMESKYPPLANPYYLTENLIPNLVGLEDAPDDSFRGYSYMLEPLIHLGVKRNMKKLLQKIWPNITRIGFKSFIFMEKWHFYGWRNTVGSNFVEIPAPTQYWNDLVTKANDDNGDSLPSTIKNYPAIFLLMLIVYPFRMNADGVRWLDKNLKYKA